MKPSSNSDDGEVLTSVEVDKVGQLFAESFDFEFDKIAASPVQEKEVLQFCLDLFLRTKLHTLFTSGGLVAVTNAVFESVAIRDFVLGLSDRTGIVLGLGEAHDYAIENSIAFGIGHKNVDRKKVLIPESILSNIEIDSETILDVLKSNKWLSVITLICLYLQYTRVFDRKDVQDSVKSNPSSPTNT